MSTLVLVGDSVFDNASYVNGPDVRAQVETKMPDDWAVSLLAVDGSYILDVPNQLEHPYETVAPLQEWDIEISQLPRLCEIPDMDGIPQHLEVAVSNFATECLAVDLAEYQLTVMRKLTEETRLRGFIRN